MFGLLQKTEYTFYTYRNRQADLTGKNITVKMLAPVIRENRKDISMDDENKVNALIIR